MRIRLYEILLILINIIFYIIILNYYNDIKQNFLKANDNKIAGFYAINVIIIICNIIILSLFSKNISKILDNLGNFILKILKTEFKI